MEKYLILGACNPGPAHRRWISTGSWASLLLHFLFVYKAKARPLWWLIPE